MARYGLLLVGHGSKLPYNRELIFETGRMIQDRSDAFSVRCGFMSIDEPTVDEQLEAFRHDEIDALVVVPLFLARGVHIEKDIPALLGLSGGQKTGTFRTNGSSIPLAYADPIGVDPLLAEMMLRNAQNALTLI
ncbi:MAG: sirohydrochlorin nickelochelatase [Methanospirillum sp.]|nr:sirohydrochlorin nickelochelatase [Methanospirillum sp.]